MGRLTKIKIKWRESVSGIMHMYGINKHASIIIKQEMWIGIQRIQKMRGTLKKKKDPS
jgi:hypothetical protein